jgi:hypothetical protein
MMPFWEEFAFRICWLLGSKPHNVENITIEIEAGRSPTITIRKCYAEKGELNQVFDVFQATHWDHTQKAPAQTWEEFLKEIRRQPGP